MRNTKISWFYLLLLILAGEAIFILPFVLPRIFRPTVLEVFQVSNTELGLCFSVYGIVAMISYVFGGIIADKYPPRKLIAIALWMTAIGGLYYAAYPNFTQQKLIYGYWGFTTIFLFWAPMIKATRVWGGENAQGKAFGILDGGRGLTGALFGTVGVLIFSFFITGDIASASLIERKEVFGYIIYSAIAFLIVVGVLVWLFLKTSDKEEESVQIDTISLEKISSVLKLRSVWLLSIIILCAYVGYKVTDYVSQFSNEVMLYDEVKSAKIGTFLMFLRPMAAVTLGFIADKYSITKWLMITFGIMLFGALLFASGILDPSLSVLYILSVFILGTGVYAIRGLYYAAMHDGKIPIVLTGTAVGIISLVGYTPDIFLGPLAGYFLDANPKQEIGHQYVFGTLAAFGVVGFITSMLYHKYYGKQILNEK